MVAVAATVTALACACSADTTNHYRPADHYAKAEFQVPMRDGVRLFTSVYTPKGDEGTYPILLVRTPYGVDPYGPDKYPEDLGPSESFARAGYLFVYQDVRGRNMSEGQFVEDRPLLAQAHAAGATDESTDTYDTIEWLLKRLPHCNGRVGLWGVSYPGFYAVEGMLCGHPAIKAASPQAPVMDLYRGDDAYRGGAFMLAATFGFYTGFKPQDRPSIPAGESHDFDYRTPDGYAFFLQMGAVGNAGPRFLGSRSELWDDEVRHTTYDDYWRERSLTPRIMRVPFPVLTVGGWFDAEDLSGPLAAYKAMARSPGSAYNGLVMGPWVHGGWLGRDGRRIGNVDFGAETAAYFREQILLPFFERTLKGDGRFEEASAIVFETGTNSWRRYAAWPAPGAETRTLYLRKGAALSFEPPAEGEPASDTYESDPWHPVPFEPVPALDVPQDYVDSDQRFAAERPDVLTYSTGPLEQDLTVVGPVEPRLFVATTGTDSDWDVKLIDVYPDSARAPGPMPPKTNDVGALVVSPLGGYQQLVRGWPFRGKFRHSLERPEPFIPDKPEEVTFTMPDINHTFRKGHRIMVQIQSSWFPLVDRNPQTFTEIPAAKPSDFRQARQRVFRWREQPSCLRLQVLPSVPASP